MKPSIGRIVHYVLTAENVEEVTRRRVDNVGHSERWPAGTQAHVGNPVSAGDTVPAIVTAVFGGEPVRLNVQAFLDGSDSLWVTSIEAGIAQGQWQWPPRAE